MSEESQNNSIFTAIKPVCDGLIMDVNKKNYDDLNYLLSTINPKAIQKFQSYIAFPIEIQLHKTANDKHKQMLVDLLTKLFSVSYVESTNVLLRITTLLLQQVITSSKDQISVAEVSEELKLSVVLCINQLWGSTMLDQLFNVYSRELYPRLSPVVFMLIQLSKNEKFVKLRVAALECLTVICHVHRSADSSDVEMCQRARNVIMLMLPGLVSCCVSIAAEPNAINHKVTLANIVLWSGIVSLVMDDNEPPDKQDDSPSVTPPSTRDEKVRQMQSQRRTAVWLQETADKLTSVTEAMLRAQSHTHWQVRQQLADSSHRILSTCPRNMRASVGPLVCCLIVLSEDEMSEVSTPAANALSHFSQALSQDSGQSLLELVEAAFYSLLNRAPRIMLTTDEGSQLTCLSLLAGYLRLQGEWLSQVLSSCPFLHRLLVGLIHMSRLETRHISLLEECSIREVETDVAVTEPWKQLKYCNTALKAAKLQAVCAILRESADVPSIIYTLVDMFDSHAEYSKEIVFLINNILAGGKPESMKDQAELVKTLVGVYLEPRLWNVPFSVTQTDSPAATTAEAQSNIVQVSLLAEGLGMFALAVGGKHFSLCLLRCLYPLLECAGSPLHPLAIAGLTAVRNVAVACVGGGVTELVQDNVDYLSHHITLRLRRALHNPGVLSVLSVVIKHTTVEVLPCLQEIIEDVLMLSRERFHEHNMNGFLRVFLTFLMCLRNWQEHTGKAEVEEMKLKQKKTIVEELLEYKHCKEAAEKLDDEEEPVGEITGEMFSSNQPSNEEYIDEDEKESKPKPVPPSIKLTVEVLQRSLHFLPSKDESRQILVLDILTEGVLVLRDEEDHLLPIVHKIWSPLVNRLQASVTKPLIMHRAFLLLCTLAETAKEFIRNRTLKQVLPSLCQSLTRSATESLLKDSGSAYRHTQLYKLQRAVLAGLGPLCADLDLREQDLDAVLTAATPYLSSRQPAPLQEHCRALYRQVAASHPDLVWLQLMSVWSPTTKLTPPVPDLPVIQLETNCDGASEFKKNVSELLEFLESL